MHDLFEGAFNYDLCLILNYFIYDANYFDVEKLIDRINNFDFGYLDVGNISAEIKEEHIRDHKLHIIISNSKFIPLMIGDLVPTNDDYWEFLLIITKINDLVQQTVFKNSDILHLNNLIKQHTLCTK